VSGLALALHQVRYDQKVFWRNPASVFFTVMFPVLFLFIFEALFGNDLIRSLGVKTSTYYVPAIITLAIFSATFQNLAMSLTIDRELGILKRTRGTPLPGWAFIAGRIGNSMVVAVIMLALVATIGRIVYSVEIPWERLPAVLVTLAVGAAWGSRSPRPYRRRQPRLRSRTRSRCPCTSSQGCSFPRARSRTGY
jgi:ABC-2 type transport system permease protein